jgi:hypothetical protein
VSTSNETITNGTFFPEHKLEELSDNISKDYRVLSSFHQMNFILSSMTRHHEGLRNDTVDVVCRAAQSSQGEVKFLAAKSLLKILETPKRFYAVGKHFETLVEIASDCSKDSEADNILTGINILRILFDIEEEVSENVFKVGGLNVIMSHCKSEDFNILEACSRAIFRAILNGGKSCNQFLVRNDSLTTWLVPMLNIYANKSIKFHAFLSLAYLRSVRNSSNEILQNGFLDDFVPWISDEETYKTLLASYSLKSIDKKKMVRQILPLLTASCKIAQTLGSLWMCSEVYNAFTSFNVEEKMTFESEEVVRALQRIVCLSIEPAKKFATSSLLTMGKRRKTSWMSGWKLLGFPTTKETSAKLES